MNPEDTKKNIKALLGAETTEVDPFEKVIIMAKLFDVMSLIALLSNRLMKADLIDEEEGDKVREIITGAQAFIGSVLEVQPELVHLAAEFSDGIPDDMVDDVKSIDLSRKIGDEAQA